MILSNNDRIVEWLKASGIPFDNVQRVVIDIRWDDVVKVYVQQLGANELFLHPFDVTPVKIECQPL